MENQCKGGHLREGRWALTLSVAKYRLAGEDDEHKSDEDRLQSSHVDDYAQS